MRPPTTRSAREWLSARGSFYAVRIARSPLGWGWIGLGLAGSLATTLAGADLLAAKPIGWWFHPGLPGARQLIFFVGIGALCCAWLGLGRRVARSSLRELLVVGALWALPLVLGPALFSRDLYSYLADG